jgi:ABC-type branched-subunit amino acid transport system ATPase component
MPEQVGDLIEQLRRLRWEIRISRDQLLKAAEPLPSSLLERAQQTAERLMGLHQKIVEISGTLPADTEIVVPEDLSESVAGLRDDGVLTLRGLDDLINDLHDFFTDRPVSLTN